MEDVFGPGADVEQPSGVVGVERSEGCPGNWGGGRYYLNKWPSARAMASIRGKVRQRTDRRYASADVSVVVGSLNPVLRGWGNYFRRGNSTRKFYAVDMYVAQRIARLASIKHGLRGINWANRFNYDWLQTLGVHQLTGTVGERGAHA